MTSGWQAVLADGIHFNASERQFQFHNRTPPTLHLQHGSQLRCQLPVAIARPPQGLFTKKKRQSRKKIRAPEPELSRFDGKDQDAG